MTTTLSIADRMVGDGASCFIVAEIGSNHNQSLDLALKSIDAAADAGVDAVKFQTFRAERHVSSKAELPTYLGGTGSTQELLKSLELDRSWHEPLMRHAADRGVIFFSSPCDIEAIDELTALGVPAHKIASFDLPDVDLIGAAAASGVPVILSTGLADWMDIQRAVQRCREVGNDDVILLQCTSLYPAPTHLSNLKAMDTMREVFGLPVGYSDHTEGDLVACAAVARGAVMIEKHFTLDRSLPGPDHPFAIEPADLATMVSRIREIEVALGDGTKVGPRDEERELADKARRSVHAARDIGRGTEILESDLIVKRPGHGIAPFLIGQIVGRTARRDIEADQWITWDMV